LPPNIPFVESFFLTKKAGHIKSLDGLRGIAVLFVLLSHSSNAGLYFSPYLDFSNTGKIGVWLFFVLSSFLLSQQIIHAVKNQKDSIAFWQRYFFKRFMRIYPLYLFALLVFWYGTTVGYDLEVVSLNSIWKHLLLLQGENVLWTIAVEFKYYLASPFIIYLFSKTLKGDFFKIVSCIILFFAISLLAIHWFDLYRISLLRYLAIFLVGTFAAFVISFSEINWFGKILFLLTRKLTVLVSALFIILSIPSVFNYFFHFEINIKSGIFYIPYAIAWGNILLYIVQVPSLLRRFFEWKLLRFLGIISYSLYLLHNPILLFFITQKASLGGFTFYIFIGVSCLLSTISYLLIERPLSRLRLNK